MSKSISPKAAALLSSIQTTFGPEEFEASADFGGPIHLMRLECGLSQLDENWTPRPAGRVRISRSVWQTLLSRGSVVVSRLEKGSLYELPVYKISGGV